MRVLALDPGNATGWARADDFAPLIVGTETFGVPRGESPGVRLLRFRAWLRKVGQGFGPGDIVLYELPHHRGGYTTEVLVQMVGEVLAWAAEVGCHHAGCSPSTLKVVSTGNGRSSKAEVLAAMRRRWPEVEVHNEHEADALALVHWHDLGMPRGLPRKRRRNVDGSKD